MQTIKRKRGSFHPLKFKTDLGAYGKTPGDVEEITFTIKDPAVLTAADDIIFRKRLTTGEITVTNVDNILSLSVDWPTAEYSNFILDTIYVAGVFYKFVGDPIADENTETIFQIVIEQDFIIA